MLTLAQLRNQTEWVIRGLEKKNIPAAAEKVKEILQADDRRKNAQKEGDTVKAKINTLSKNVGELMRSGQQDADVEWHRDRAEHRRGQEGRTDEHHREQQRPELRLDREAEAEHYCPSPSGRGKEPRRGGRVRVIWARSP